MDGTRTTLVVATASCTDEAVRAVAASLPADGPVALVAPMPASPLNYWLNDQRARDRAVERLDAWSAALRGHGHAVTAEVGDDDPLQAMDDAVVVHRPAQAVLVTPTSTQAGWLEAGFLAAARERFPFPVEHVAVSEAGAVVEDAAAGRREERLHPTRDALVCGVLTFLSALGSAFWFIGPAIGSVPEWALVCWALFADVGPKTVLFYLIWRLYLKRRFGDRIAAPVAGR